MNQFYSIFAMKTPPESTIDRIVALENQAKDLTARLEKNEKQTDSIDKDLKSFKPKVEENHEKRITDLENAVKELGNVQAPTGEVDTAAIMMKINLLSVEINKKIDVHIHNQQMDNNYSKLKDMID